MADILMYNPKDDKKIAPSVDYNQWLQHLDTQLNEPTNKKPRKILKVVKPMTKKKTLL